MAFEDGRSPVLTLNDGKQMPQLGLGLMRFGGEDETGAVISRAYEAGYRLFDTAAAYGTERQTGDGFRALECGRDDFFITTKLWNASQGYDEARAAMDRSLERLGFDYVDLYLVHWPMPDVDKYVESWKALIAMRDAGQARSIGVSNFQPAHLKRIVDETGVVPAVNQIEMHPRFQQHDLNAVHKEMGIVPQAWSPLGAGGKGNLMEDPVILEIASKHSRSASEVIIAWHLSQGGSLIPKATSKAHLEQNLGGLDVKLDEDDLGKLAGMDRDDGRFGLHPDTMHIVRELGDA